MFFLSLAAIKMNIELSAFKLQNELAAKKCFLNNAYY